MSASNQNNSAINRQTAFLNECDELANDIVNNMERQEGMDIEQYISDRVRDHAEDMSAAYADGLIYSYGTSRAIRIYVADCQAQSMNPYPLDDDEESLFSNGVVSVIMENPVRNRVMALLQEHHQ